MDWAYDGSWQGYLAAVFRAREAKDREARFAALPEDLAWRLPGRKKGENRSTPAQGSLDFHPLDHQDDKAPPLAGLSLQAYGPQADDPELARRVLAGLDRLGGPESVLLARDAFLNRDSGNGTEIWQFILLCTQKGKGALKEEANPFVRQVLDRAQAVRRQAHKFMGILRFQELDGAGGLYGAMEPDHHILPLLAEHFLPRMGNQTWMIHDRLRHLGIVHHQGRLEALRDLQVDDELPLSDRERQFQDLWKGFFKAAAIPGKENPGLQRAHLPKKFWSCLIEVPRQ